MNDVVLLAVAAVVVVAVPFDWVVAVKLTAAARGAESPTLNLAAGRSIAIAIAATIGGVLGIHTIAFYALGVRLIPPPFPAFMIGAALIVISIPNIYAMRLLRAWSPPYRRRRTDRTP